MTQVRAAKFIMGFALVTAALTLVSCVTPPEKPESPAPEIAYPPPPDAARFIFERSLLSSADVQKRDSTTRFRQLVTGERTTGEALAKPFDVVVCQGRIYVSDTVRRSVMVFDIPGGRFFEIGTEEPGALNKPLGLTTDGACNLYVADTTAQRVMKYDRNGVFLTAMGGKDAKLFTRLSHLAVTPDGKKLFAVDTGGVDSTEHKVHVFDVMTGEPIYAIGTRGDEVGKLNLPRDAEIGPDGLLYVVDGGNFRVQAFRQDGTFVRSFGSVGRQLGQFSRPKGIAADPDGNLYVSDAYFANFQIFNSDGELLMFIGTRGAQASPGNYMLPAGIDVDEDGRIFVVDQFFRKVDIFRPAGLPKEGGYLGAWYRQPVAQ